jgi:YhgE/Pip-like protein
MREKIRVWRVEKMGLLKQKQLWISIVAVFVVLMVFGAAMMGSVLGAKPRDLPVALVVLDEKAEIPGGGTLDVGAMVREKLLANTALPVKWQIVGSEAAAREGLQEREYYGALVLPVDMSSGMLGLVSSAGGSRGSSEGGSEGSSASNSEGSSGGGFRK